MFPAPPVIGRGADIPGVGIIPPGVPAWPVFIIAGAVRPPGAAWNGVFVMCSAPVLAILDLLNPSLALVS